MINEFKTLLANVAPSPRILVDGETIPFNNEHIAYAFRGVQLSKPLAAFEKILFAGVSNREEKIMLAGYMVSVINSTDLAGFITKYDRRITYSFDNYGETFDAFTPDTTSTRWDFLTLYNAIKNQSDIIANMLQEDSFSGVTYTEQENAVYNFANLIVCYVDRVKVLL